MNEKYQYGYCATCWWWVDVSSVRDERPRGGLCELEPQSISKTEIGRCQHWQDKREGWPLADA